MTASIGERAAAVAFLRARAAAGRAIPDAVAHIGADAIDCMALSLEAGQHVASPTTAPSTLPAPPDDAQPVSTALLVALGAFLENVYGSHGLVDAGLRERARELRGLLAGEVDP